MACDPYSLFYTKINDIIEKRHIDNTTIDELGLLYFLTIDEFFNTFYFPVLSLHQKEYYGEVNTPNLLADELLSFLDLTVNTTLNLPTFLDSGAGLGYISAVLVKTLFNIYNNNVAQPQPELIKREHWLAILKHITLVEINTENIQLLKLFFGQHCTIFNGDYLNYFPSLQETGKYDIVIGNPPFNINGTIKVPTNNTKSKKTMERRYGEILYIIHYTIV
jgi:hypothetical protein